MLTEIIVCVVAVCFAIGTSGHIYGAGANKGRKEIERKRKPYNKYDVVIIPQQGGYSPISDKDLRRPVRFLAQSLTRDNLHLTEYISNGYKVIVRHTEKGWNENQSYVSGTYWTQYHHDTDTIIGIVDVDDPDFDEKLITLKAKAEERISTLRAIEC